MALHSLYCADVPLRNCSLTHPHFKHCRCTLYYYCLSSTISLPSSAVNRSSKKHETGFHSEHPEWLR